MNKENEELARRVRALEAERAKLRQQKTEVTDRLRVLMEENTALSQKIERLEDEAQRFNQKLGECDAVFRRCHKAYGDSLIALQRQSVQQINSIGMQLAMTHDRLRRYKKIVDSLPVGESLSSVTSLEQSFASGLYDGRADGQQSTHQSRTMYSGSAAPRSPPSPPKRVPSKLSSLLASQGAN